MVALPKIERQLVTTQAATSSVSAGDYAAVGRMQGAALTQLGEAADALAVRAAEQAAETAVTRDAEGNVQVARMPLLVGPAAKAYADITETRFLAQQQNAVKQKVTEARVQYDGKPEEFKAWGEEYVERLVSNAASEKLASQTRTIAERATTEAYDGLKVRRHNLDLKSANEAIDASLMTTAKELESIALQGGVQSEGFRTRMADFNALLDQKVNNPLLAYPKEKADLFRDTMLTNVYTAVTLEATERVYRAQGFEAARAHLDEAVKALGGTVKESEKIRAKGLALLRSEEAGFRAERSEIGREWSQIKGQAATTPPEVLADLAQRADAVGNWRVASDVRANAAALSIIPHLRSLPVAEQAQIASTGRVGAVRSNLPPELDAHLTAGAARVGLDPNLARRIVQIESGGNPNAGTGSYKGLFQLSAEEFARHGGKGDILDPRANIDAGLASLAVRAKTFSDRFGRQPTATELYLAHQQGDAGLAAHMTNPTRPAWQSMLSTGEGQKKGEGWAKKAIWGNIPDDMKAQFPGGVDSVTSEQFMSVWARKVEGASYTASLTTARETGRYGGAAVTETNLYDTPAGRLAIGMLKKELAKDLSKRIADFSTGDRMTQLPSADELQAMGAEVEAIGTPEQKRKVEELQLQASVGAAVADMKPDQREATIAALRAQNAEGASQFKHSLVKRLEDAEKARTAAYEKDPYGAYSRFAHNGQALPNADFGNPSQVAALLAEKVKLQAQIREQEQLPAFSVFRPAEAGAFRQAVTQGDPQVGGQLLGTLAKLPTEQFMATLADKEVRAALDGMVRSYDPARMTPAMALMDRAWREDPLGFKQTFSGETATRLQVWQSFKDSHSAAEIAEKFKLADSPQMAAARKNLESAAETEIKTLTSSKIAATMYEIDHPLLSWVPFTGHAAPTDGLQSEAFKVEYSDLYKEFRRQGLDPGDAEKRAAERTATIWGNSPVAGQIMRHPPEKYYKPIDNSHAWMGAALQADLTALRGDPNYGDLSGAGWQYKILSDNDTEVDISNKRPPSYQVWVFDGKTGTTDLVRDSTGKGRRFYFDDSKALEAARQAFGPRRERALEPRPALGEIGVP